MHIAIVCEFFPHVDESGVEGFPGGAEAWAYYVSKNLIKFGHKVTVIATRQAHLPDVVKINNLTIVRVGKPYSYTEFGKFRNRYFLIKEVSRVIKQIPYIDIINCCTWFSYAVFFPKEIPSVVTYHDVRLKLWRKFFGAYGILFEIAEKWILQRPWTAFIAPTNFTKNDLLENGIDEKKIHIIPYGVELESIPPTEGKFKDPTICFVGRLVEHKRPQDFVSAIGILHKEYPDIKGILVGTGPLKDSLEKQAKDLGITNNIQFITSLPNHTEVFKIIQKSHIFSLPSIHEGFGIVVSETMACGTPHVCTSIPSITEACMGGKGGFLVPVMSPDKLAEKMKLLLKDKDLYKKLSEEGKETAKLFQWKKIAKDIEKMYLTLLR